MFNRLNNPFRSWRSRLFVGVSSISVAWAFRKLQDWYPIEVGTYPITASNFMETKSYKELLEKLKRDYKKQTNYLFLSGDSGTGKTIALGQVYSNTPSWFKGGLFSLQAHPWVKLWVSIPHDVTFSNSQPIVREQMLKMAKKIHQETYAVIIKNKWLTESANWLSKKLPVILQPNFIKNFIQDNEEQTLKNLKHYLEAHPGWLIALDNLQTTQEVTAMLPSKGGIIIITTNNEQLPFNQDSKIKFDLLDMDDSKALIKKNLTNRYSDEDITELAEGMGRSPLGIVQACGYINGAKVSISTYLKRLCETPLKILAHDEIIEKHPNLVRTLQLMLEHIQEAHKKLDTNTTSNIYNYLFGSSLTLEKRLLFIMSLLDSQEVPARLLQEAFFNIIKKQDETIFNDATKILTQFNVIDYQEKGDYFKLHTLKHRILQAMIRSSVLDEPYWLSWDMLKYYFSQNPSLLDAVLKAFSQVKTTPDTLLNPFSLLKHAIYLDNLIKKASPKRYNKKEYNAFAIFKLELLSRLFSNDNSTTSKKASNLELRPHVKESLLFAASKKITVSDELILDLSIKEAFLKLMNAEGKKAYEEFKKLYEQCHKQVNFSNNESPRDIYQKLNAKSKRLPLLYIALVYGLGRSHFYLSSDEQKLLLVRQEKCFKECIELCNEITKLTGQNIAYHYWAKRSGLLIMMADRDDINTLPGIIKEYEQMANDNTLYLDDEGKQYHFADDSLNKIDLYDRIIKLNLKLIKLYPPAENLENKRQTCLTTALQAANNMLAELKKAEDADYPIERSSKYYNTVGKFWFDHENPNRNLSKALSYFRKAVVLEKNKAGNPDFPLGDAHLSMAKIYREKQQWTDASKSINECIDIYQSIQHTSLKEAKELQLNISVDIQNQGPPQVNLPHELFSSFI